MIWTSYTASGGSIEAIVPLVKQLYTTSHYLMYFKVLARPFPKGTVPFGGSNMPFGSASKETMCPLAPPQNQPIFNSHLNYLNLKTVWALSIELSEH